MGFVPLFLVSMTLVVVAVALVVALAIRVLNVTNSSDALIGSAGAGGVFVSLPF